MKGQKQCSTDFLILRKTPYSETSLVVAGLSPDLGQIHFMVRGARKVGGRNFPLIDLFRILHVQYRQGKSELHTWQSADLVRDFAGVARNLNGFQTAGWLARFALANIPGGLECRRVFDAMKTGLAHLEGIADEPSKSAKLRHATMVGVCLVYLSENGLIPDYENDACTKKQCLSLIAAALGECALPSLTTQSWQSLFNWTLSLLRHAECVVPE